MWWFWPYIDMNQQMLLFRLHNITPTCPIPFVRTSITEFQPITSHLIVFLHLLLPSCNAKTTEAGGNQGMWLLQVKAFPLLLECDSSSPCGPTAHTVSPVTPLAPSLPVFQPLGLSLCSQRCTQARSLLVIRH